MGSALGFVNGFLDFSQASMASLTFASDDWVKVCTDDGKYYWKPWTDQTCFEKVKTAFGARKDPATNRWYFWKRGSQESFWLFAKSRLSEDLDSTSSTAEVSHGFSNVGKHLESQNITSAVFSVSASTFSTPSSLPRSSAASSQDDASQHRTVATASLVPNDFCFYKYKNNELKDMAMQKKLPHVAEMDRNNLLESLRLVVKWEAMDLKALRNAAKVIALPVQTMATREDIIAYLIQMTFGGWRKASSKISISSTQTTPCASQELPQDKPCCQPQSKLQFEDKLAIEVVRILESVAKESKSNWQAVLGFSCGEVLSLELVRSKYRHLMLLLHPDKRTEEAIVKVGNLQSIEEAFQHVQDAYKIAYLCQAPPKPVGPAAASATSPKSPPGSKPPRPFGWGPINPLPPPHPNFTSLRILIAD